MQHIFEKIHLPFVYGPLTEEEVKTIAVSKVQIPEPDGYYVGTYVELTEFVDRKLFKWVPPSTEEG